MFSTAAHKTVSTAVAQVIERENAEVVAVSNARTDTTQACVINTTQCLLDTSRQRRTTEDKSLPAIVLLKIEGAILWAYLY